MHQDRRWTPRVALDAAMAMDPLTDKGSKIMRSMKEKYGEEKGERVFYASRNKGNIKGVDASFEEGKHPRDHGKFTSGSGGGSYNHPKPVINHPNKPYNHPRPTINRPNPRDSVPHPIPPDHPLRSEAGERTRGGGTARFHSEAAHRALVQQGFRPSKSGHTHVANYYKPDDQGRQKHTLTVMPYGGSKHGFTWSHEVRNERGARHRGSGEGNESLMAHLSRMRK